jgi:hypothetical protein
VVSNGNSLIVQPGDCELEVSVFGPGYGECILVHLGHGDWIVVDSCLDPTSRKPAALRYLEFLGLDPAPAIRLVVATHWHDDHIDGLGEVFRRSRESEFACTAALGQPAFNDLLSASLGARFIVGGSGIDELWSILAELKQRSPNSNAIAPRLAVAGRRLWPLPNKRSPLPASVHCLSPSDAAVIASVSRLDRILPSNSKVRRRIPRMDPNDTSIVLSVEAGAH